MKRIKLMKGDNMESLKKLPDNSIDSIVTDPPYGLSFMGKKWDYDVPSVEFWTEVYRVLKPGGHILSFGGTRTYHRMVVNIEDAGFEIRDQVMWLYGSGFPKSHNIGKSVDKIQGNEREVISIKENYLNIKGSGKSMYDDAWHGNQRIDLEETRGSSPYEGWGTALKPANEPICVARKPLSEKTIAENVIKWGTGGINIDGCRVGTDDKLGRPQSQEQNSEIKLGLKNNEYNGYSDEAGGRFPANIILDETAAELLDEQSGVSKSRTKYPEQGLDNLPMNHYEETKIKHIAGKEQTKEGFTDKGGASRFFFNVKQTDEEHQTNSRFLYVAKVSKKERNLGLDGFEEKMASKTQTPLNREEFIKAKNTHPTLKPINLMTYLCRLVTPEGGIVLDPFMGSGSTGIAAQLEGFRFVGMEMDEDYFKIAEARINSYEQYRDLLKKK